MFEVLSYTHCLSNHLRLFPTLTAPQALNFEYRDNLFCEI